MALSDDDKFMFQHPFVFVERVQDFDGPSLGVLRDFHETDGLCYIFPDGDCHELECIRSYHEPQFFTWGEMTELAKKAVRSRKRAAKKK